MHAVEQSKVSENRSVDVWRTCKPNSTATRTGATRAMYQLETLLLCNASQELNVFIPVRQPNSTVLGDGIFRDLPTLRCQVGKRALVHFVRPAVRSCSSAAAITAAEGLGNRPSSIFRHPPLDDDDDDDTFPLTPVEFREDEVTTQVLNAQLNEVCTAPRRVRASAAQRPRAWRPAVSPSDPRHKVVIPRGDEGLLTAARKETQIAVHCHLFRPLLATVFAMCLQMRAADLSILVRRHHHHVRSNLHWTASTLVNHLFVCLPDHFLSINL